MKTEKEGGGKRIKNKRALLLKREIDNGASVMESQSISNCWLAAQQKQSIGTGTI